MEVLSELSGERSYAIGMSDRCRWNDVAEVL